MPRKPPKEKLATVNDKIYQEIAREMDIPVKLVKDVVMNGQSKFTAYTMADNTFDGIRWPYFGAFKAKHKIVQVYNHMKGLDPAQRAFFKDMITLKYLAQKHKNNFPPLPDITNEEV